MARCKQCGAEIPDGLEYCEECADKLNTAKASESYLDSLLNAVMTEEPERREIAYQRREASSPVSVSEKEKSELKREEKKREESVSVKEPENFFAEKAPFLSGDALPNLENYSIFEESDEAEIDRMLEADLQVEESELFFEQEEPEFFKEDKVPVPEAFEETDPSEPEAFEEVDTFETNLVEEPSFVEPEIADLFEIQEGAEGIEEFSEEEGDSALAEEPVETDEFSDFADLFAGGDKVPETMEEAMPDLFENNDYEEIIGDAEANSGGEALSDFADLFGIGEDGTGIFEFGMEPQDMEELLGSIQEEESDQEVPKPMGEEPESAEKFTKSKKEKKQGSFVALFHKLFDNVKVDPSKIKRELTPEEKEEKKKAAQEAKERTKEEKEALLAEKKEQEKQAKAEKRRLVLEAKAEKKARKLEEAKLLLEEMESTRINRAGASIVFIFFAMIAVLIVVGTSIFSYSLSIRNAQYEFDRDEYTLAYNEIFGLDIKDEDIVLYDRIMTVMYVQKQLNSYYNYYEMKDYPKALDSLLKGLQRYEKYIELAVELEIESDLDSVRSGIITELDASFSMSEQEAMNILQSDSQLEYSMLVYDATDGMKSEAD